MDCRCWPPIAIENRGRGKGGREGEDEGEVPLSCVGYYSSSNAVTGKYYTTNTAEEFD